MKLKSFASVCAIIATGLTVGGVAEARDRIQIVGSSTVFPFATAVAERYGQQTGNTPTVESTGSGGGLKLFCEGVGVNTPDITNASRKIKDSEIETCKNNGVTPVEVSVGFDGIVIANSKENDPSGLTLEQVYLALAAQIPSEGGALVENPNMNWSDIDPTLPNKKIEVLGPPPTSGTRDAFVELAMEAGCESAAERFGMEIDGDDCAKMREDGAFVEAGENDNLIVQKLDANPDAYGIFGYSFLVENEDSLQGATIGGVEPTFDNIASGDYPVARSLFFYVKKEHVGVIPGLEDYVSEFTSDAAWGDDGYLAEKGLIPLPEETRAQEAQNAQTLTPVEGF